MSLNCNAVVLNGNNIANKYVLQANIPFILLKEGRVQFTYMKESLTDPYAFDSDNFEALAEDEAQNFYQRRVNENRVKEIKKFIRDSILDEHYGKSMGVIFPTALLLAVNSEEPVIPGKHIVLDKLLADGKRFFIVDGQHRLYSMIKLYEEVNSPNLFPDIDSDDQVIKRYLDNYKFNCTILLNFDLWEQARIFADVNFNQRKVDRSLYYSIYGMNYTNDKTKLRNNYIFIAHHLVKFLNSSYESPLKGMVRMLGNGDGVISQAFLADALIRHIRSPRGIWYVDSMEDKTKGNYRYMAKELITFFTVLKNMIPDYWPLGKEHRSIMLKTTGIGALMRLMGAIHQNYLDDSVIEALNNDNETGYIVQKYYDTLKDLLNPIVLRAESLFGFDSEFASAGGGGLQSKLYYNMLNILESWKGAFIEQKTFTVNGVDLKANIYRNQDGMYVFELSHYFQNPDQGLPYIPGSGSIAESKEHLEFKLQLYIDQIHPQATIFPNKDFKN